MAHFTVGKNALIRKRGSVGDDAVIRPGRIMQDGVAIGSGFRMDGSIPAPVFTALLPTGKTAECRALLSPAKKRFRGNQA